MECPHEEEREGLALSCTSARPVVPPLKKRRLVQELQPANEMSGSTTHPKNCVLQQVVRVLINEASSLLLSANATSSAGLLPSDLSVDGSIYQRYHHPSPVSTTDGLNVLGGHPRSLNCASLAAMLQNGSGPLTRKDSDDLSRFSNRSSAFVQYEREKKPNLTSIKKLKPAAAREEMRLRAKDYSSSAVTLIRALGRDGIPLFDCIEQLLNDAYIKMVGSDCGVHCRPPQELLDALGELVSLQGNKLRLKDMLSKVASGLTCVKAGGRLWSLLVLHALGKDFAKKHVSILICMLDDKHDDVGHHAAKTVGILGEHAVPFLPHILSYIVEAADPGNDRALWNSLTALQGLGPVASGYIADVACVLHCFPLDAKEADSLVDVPLKRPRESLLDESGAPIPDNYHECSVRFADHICKTLASMATPVRVSVGKSQQTVSPLCATESQVEAEPTVTTDISVIANHLWNDSEDVQAAVMRCLCQLGELAVTYTEDVMNCVRNSRFKTFHTSTSGHHVPSRKSAYDMKVSSAISFLKVTSKLTTDYLKKVVPDLVVLLLELSTTPSPGMDKVNSNIDGPYSALLQTCILGILGYVPEETSKHLESIQVLLKSDFLLVRTALLSLLPSIGGMGIFGGALFDELRCTNARPCRCEYGLAELAKIIEKELKGDLLLANLSTAFRYMQGHRSKQVTLAIMKAAMSLPAEVLKDYLFIFVRFLRRKPDCPSRNVQHHCCPTLRLRALEVLSLTSDYIDKYIGQIEECLGDEDARVRKTAGLMLIHQHIRQADKAKRALLDSVASPFQYKSKLFGVSHLLKDCDADVRCAIVTELRLLPCTDTDPFIRRIEGLVADDCAAVRAAATATLKVMKEHASLPAGD
mmetsp:Transcript_7029/g.25914  ORF Transcript_7029/g.25914 Transcript_7029/m.25914 type:complete len:869 (+) Transcript_7029:23-2629(+)